MTAIKPSERSKTPLKFTNDLYRSQSIFHTQNGISDFRPTNVADP